MRFMVLVKASKNSETGVLPDVKAFTDMGAFNEQLVKAGVFETAGGLHPSAKGSRVRFAADGRKSVVDGPFTETKELVGGYWIWNCKSLEEAMEWAKKCPSPHPGEECDIEVRPIISAEDFAQMLERAGRK